MRLTKITTLAIAFLAVAFSASAQWTWTWDTGDRIVGGPYQTAWFDAGTKTSPGALSQGNWATSSLARNAMQAYTNNELEVFSDTTESGKIYRLGGEFFFDLLHQPYVPQRPFTVVVEGEVLSSSLYEIDSRDNPDETVTWYVLFEPESGVKNNDDVQVDYSWISGNARWIRLSGSQLQVLHFGDELTFRTNKYEAAYQENQARDEFGGDGCLVCLQPFQAEPVNYHAPGCWIGVEGESLGRLDP